MSLNIILGKPKTGKSSYIYEKIEEDIENNRNVILFVPSQQRQETENNYMEFLKKDGIIIIETDEEERELEELNNNKNINIKDLRRYGRVKLIFLNRKG